MSLSYQRAKDIPPDPLIIHCCVTFLTDDNHIYVHVPSNLIMVIRSFDQKNASSDIGSVSHVNRQIKCCISLKLILYPNPLDAQDGYMYNILQS